MVDSFQECSKSMKTPATSCITWCVHKQVHIATDLTINSCEKLEFIKFTVQTLNAQLSVLLCDTQDIDSFCL